MCGEIDKGRVHICSPDRFVDSYGIVYGSKTRGNRCIWQEDRLNRCLNGKKRGVKLTDGATTGLQAVVLGRQLHLMCNVKRSVWRKRGEGRGRERGEEGRIASGR